ncbi:MAG: glycosyltransferase [Acidobacteria bacterium]|nr:glycosyltransferase [Acidobacteriota bacterium]
MKSQTAPMFSVIVPVYNSHKELAQCLASLTGSQFDDFEVIVVDDGSEIPIEPLVVKNGFRYLRIDGPGGPARARNRGAQSARGRFVVFIDADVCVQHDTLALLAQAFTEDRTIDAVIGSYDDSPAHPGFISQYKNLFHHYVHQNSTGDIKTFWSGCGAMRRDTFLDFGGFDEERYRRPAIEDIELGTWVSAAGHRIVLDGRIRVKHLKKWTFVNLLMTDIFDRGIPWTRLMLRAGEVVKTLNVTSAQRLSVALTYLTLFVLLAAVLYPKLSLGAAALALTVTLLNLDYYRFLNNRQGLWFTLRVMPLHWLYFLYCGFCAVSGTMLHYLDNVVARDVTRDRTRFWTVLIILVAGSFYLSTIRQGHYWGDDFAMYISHGRNIAEGRAYADTGYIYNTQRIIGPKTYPPVYPLLLAPVYKLWGLNLTAMKIEVILIFLLSLFVIYLAFRDELQWRYLLTLVAFVGLNPQFWLYKDNITADMPFLLFTYLSFYLIHQAYRTEHTVASQVVYAVSISVSLYLAYGTRSIGLLLIPCLLVYHLIKSKRAVLFGLFIILPTAVFIYLQTRTSHGISAYADHLQFNLMKVALYRLLTLFEYLSGYWTHGSSKVFPLALAAVLTGLAVIGYLARIGKKQVTCFELYVLFYFTSFMVLPVTLEVRYLIPIIPLYLFFAFQGIQTISRLTASRRQQAERLVFAGVLITVMVSYTGQFATMDYRPIQTGIGKPETQQLFETVKREVGENEVVIFRKPRALTLFTGRASATWHYPRDDAELFDFFRHVNASYLIVGPPDLEPYDQTFIRNFVERNRDRFQKTYANADFSIYRIVEGMP